MGKTEEFYRGDLYYALGMLFPRLTRKVRIYRPLGNNAIHLLLNDGRELAFTYVHRRRWLIETYEHYKDRTGDDDQIKLAELDVKSWLMERFERVD